MLLHNLAGCRARYVHRHISAADDDDFLPDRELVSQVHIQQEVNSFVHSIKIDTWDTEIAATMRSHGDQHGIEALPPQFGNRKVAPGSMIQLQRDVSRLQNLADLRLHHASRQSVFRDSQIQHSARDRRGFEDRHRITHQREIVRSRESHRPSAHHCNFEWEFVLPAPFIDVHGVL